MLFTSGLPNSDAAANSSSRSTGCTFIVTRHIVTLSISVTVRDHSWSNYAHVITLVQCALYLSMTSGGYLAGSHRSMPSDGIAPRTFGSGLALSPLPCHTVWPSVDMM